MKQDIKENIHQIEEKVRLGRADLHIHSNHSDARPSIAEILKYVENETKLDVIAIADHDTINGAIEAKSLMEEGNFRFELVIAEEVTSKDGHILALFIKEKIKKGLSARETIRAIHQQGGLAIAAHPFQHTRMRNPKMPIMDGVGLITLIKEKEYFDGIEVTNATPTLSEQNLSADFINTALIMKAETGSSDAHILEAIGMGYTLFEGKSSADLREALEKYQTKAMHRKWGLPALFKYLFFFIPKGLRLAIYTLIHGRTEKKHRIVKK